MMDAKGTTLSEAWITGSINSGLLLQEGKKRPKQEDDDDIIDAELK